MYLELEELKFSQVLYISILLANATLDGSFHCMFHDASRLPISDTFWFGHRDRYTLPWKGAARKVCDGRGGPEVTLVTLSEGSVNTRHRQRATKRAEERGLETSFVLSRKVICLQEARHIGCEPAARG